MTKELQRELGSVLWSNANASEEACIRSALLRPRFHLLLSLSMEFGLDRLTAEWEFLKSCDDRTGRVGRTVERMLDNIREGFRHASL